MDEILQQLLQAQNPNLQDIGGIPRPTSSEVGNLIKGIPAGLAGMPVDIVSAAMRPFGYDTPPEQTVGSAEWFGSKMGADTQSGPFLAGQFVSPDAMDAFRAAGLLGVAGKKLGGSVLADELDKIGRKRKALDDYENDVTFVEMDTKVPDTAARVKTTGAYRGAPRGTNSPQKLGSMRRNLWNLLEQGSPGRDWYDQSAQAMNELTGSRRNYKHLAAGTNAITSRGASVPVNQLFGVKGFNQAITGQPAKAGRFPNTQGEAIDTLASGQTYYGGPKETPFYEGLTIDERAQGIRPTNDLWMARAFGYTKPDGSEWGEGLAKSQHRFMDKEINHLAKQANKAELGGHSDWTPEKVQAAIWVAKKAEMEGTSIEKAAGDFSHNLDNLTGTIRWEANPSTSIEHLPGISTSDEYADIARAMTQDDMGRDLLALETGALTRPSDAGYGIYEGALSPSSGTRIMMAPETGSNVADPASMALAKGIGSGRGLTMGQDTAGITTMRPAKNAFERNIANIPEGPVSGDRMREIETELMKRFSDEAFPLHAPGGFEVVHNEPVIGPKLGGEQFTKRLKKLYGRDIKTGYNSGDLIGNTDWDNPGYKPSAWMREIEAANLGPAEARLERGVRAEADAMNKVDALLSKSVPDAGSRSELLTRTREILVKDGFEGVRAAVRAGILPVAVLGIAGSLMQGQDYGISR